MKRYELPRATDELWRRTKPDLFLIPTEVEEDPLTAESGVNCSRCDILAASLKTLANSDALIRESRQRLLAEHGLVRATFDTATDGLVLTVPDRADSAELDWNTTLVESASSALLNRLHVGQDVEVTLNEHLEDRGGTQASIVTLVTIRSGAKVTWNRIWSVRRRVFHRLLVHVEAGASLKLTTYLTGTGLAKVEQSIVLAGAGATVDEFLVDEARQRFHADVTLGVRHAAPDATSRVEARGVVLDRGYSLHHGLLQVDQEARGTDTYVTSRHLLLGPKARADSIPKLEIHIDEVKAGHGATIGDLDPEAVYYLQTRGFSREQAVDILVQGFLGALYDRSPWFQRLEASRAA